LPETGFCGRRDESRREKLCRDIRSRGGGGQAKEFLKSEGRVVKKRGQGEKGTDLWETAV